MGAAAEAFLASIPSPQKRTTHQAKWNNAREFFKLWDVVDVTPKVLMTFSSGVENPLPRTARRSPRPPCIRTW